MERPYDSAFYNSILEGASRSARAVVPYVLQITEANSVIDVGCGQGVWLQEYARHGLSDLLGLDGEWVDLSTLRISADRFNVVDLRYPTPLGRRYDLAQCLEVAEHLPAGAATSLVDFLTGVSDVILFSAATPEQGGTDHLNEQWPGYWRALFAKRGYKLYDAFRTRFWSDADVTWWYAQNMFLYVNDARDGRLPICETLGEGWLLPERVVHPHRLDPVYRVPRSLRAIMRSAPRTLLSACRQSVRGALRGRLP